MAHPAVGRLGCRLPQRRRRTAQHQACGRLVHADGHRYRRRRHVRRPGAHPGPAIGRHSGIHASRPRRHAAPLPRTNAPGHGHRARHALHGQDRRWLDARGRPGKLGPH
ncbi:hypothetical protein G6F32_015591 [Rhizopus arrhizus]|nr:hypothetical protein G6F32_015591 [Rhizopus arrhizus]